MSNTHRIFDWGKIGKRTSYSGRRFWVAFKRELLCLKEKSCVVFEQMHHVEASRELHKPTERLRLLILLALGILHASTHCTPNSPVQWVPLWIKRTGKWSLKRLMCWGLYRCGFVERFRAGHPGSNSPSGSGDRVFKSTNHAVPKKHWSGAKLRASFPKTSEPFGALI